MTRLPDPQHLAVLVNGRGTAWVCDAHGITGARLAEYLGEHGYRAVIWAGHVKYVAERRPASLNRAAT